MQNSVDAILGLRKSGQIETSVFCGATGTPCYIDCNGMKCRETRYTRDEVVEALATFQQKEV